MPDASAAILALNGGSSSIRFALLRADDALRRLRGGQIRHLGRTDAHLAIDPVDKAAPARIPLAARDHGEAVDRLVQWLEREEAGVRVAAVGHRVVHGMQHFEPERVTPELLATLRAFVPVDPDHLPVELALIEAAQRRLPGVPHVACFDTLFHRDLPAVAARLPIPRRLMADGLRRYGFHGLSYAWLMEALERAAGRTAARGRVILAHLGGGASIAAVRDGRCRDTTMGFTPTAGLMMGRRSGDLDPSLGPYLERTAGMTGARFLDMVNHESGLLGVSETSGDMQELLRVAASDPRAEEAIALFCYIARKAVAGMAAALGGMDTLVFSGGIGEGAAPVRARICDGLGFLGVEIDAGRNASNDALVSTPSARVAVRVIPTNEEHVIARSVRTLLAREHMP
jgi:acetate kinase